MPLTTGIDTGNDNQVAVFTTPTNSATIGHLSDSVPHKQPTLRETAEPHDAVPGSAGSSNGLSPHEGIFGLLNHRVGPRYHELPRNSSPHDHSRSLRPDFGEHERSQNKLYEQCLYGEAWCGMVAFCALLPQADLDGYLAAAKDNTYLARQTLFRAQQVQNAIADEKGRRAMRALLASRAAGMPAAVSREPKVGDWARAPRADGSSAVQSLGPRIQTCTLSEGQTAPAVVSSSQRRARLPQKKLVPKPDLKTRLQRLPDHSFWSARHTRTMTPSKHSQKPQTQKQNKTKAKVSLAELFQSLRMPSVSS